MLNESYLTDETLQPAAPQPDFGITQESLGRAHFDNEALKKAQIVNESLLDSSGE